MNLSEFIKKNERKKMKAFTRLGTLCANLQIAEEVIDLSQATRR